MVGLWCAGSDRGVGGVVRGSFRSQLMTAAHQSGILQHADESAAKVLRDLLSVDGYTVEIRRPVVKRQPIG